MRCLGPILLVGAGLYLIHRSRKLKAAEVSNQPMVPVKGNLPPGTRPTGRVKRTTNTDKPGSEIERLAYEIRDWIEVMLPDGTFDWVQIDRAEME